MVDIGRMVDGKMVIRDHSEVWDAYDPEGEVTIYDIDEEVRRARGEDGDDVQDPSRGLEVSNEIRTRDRLERLEQIILSAARVEDSTLGTPKTDTVPTFPRSIVERRCSMDNGKAGPAGAVRSKPGPKSQLLDTALRRNRDILNRAKQEAALRHGVGVIITTDEPLTIDTTPEEGAQ